MIVGAFVIGAVFTPPDVISQLMLAVPMWVLYELGHRCSRSSDGKHTGADDARRRRPDMSLSESDGSSRLPGLAGLLRSACVAGDGLGR